jgi:DNA-binding response OmpR family regulator
MKRQHILLLGEKKENALPLSLFLESCNFQVTVEEKGNRIVEQFRQYQDPLEPYDLLIAGTQMSEKLLLELLSKMESRKIGLPFIMISDNSNQAWVKRIRGKYAGIHVTNPTESNELIKVVGQIFKNNGK